MKKLYWLMLLLTSCATPYQPLSLGGGFSETQLSENIFTVSFRGNGYTDKERTTDFVMLRDAELTLNNKFKYFKIINSIDDSRSSIYTTPIVANTTGYTNTSGTLGANTFGTTYGNTYSSNTYGTWNGSTYGNATTTISGGNSYLITKPKFSNTIACFKSKPKDGMAFDAKLIKESIMTKYNLNKIN